MQIYLVSILYQMLVYIVLVEQKWANPNTNKNIQIDNFYLKYKLYFNHTLYLIIF